jgi:hypothetical protein
MKSMLEFANEHPFLFLIGILCGTIIASTIVSVLKEILLKIFTYPLNLMHWANIHKHGWPPGVECPQVNLIGRELHDADLEAESDAVPEVPPVKGDYHA